MSLARYLGALTVCYGGAGTEQELPPPLLPKDAIYESMPRPQQFWRLPPYLHAHLEYIYSTDVTDEHVTRKVRFLPRLREVHIGGAHNLMRGGKLYRSGHPVFLSYPGDMIVWSSDSPFGRLTAHERDMTALRRRYPNMKLLINLNLRPFADGTEAFLGNLGFSVAHVPVRDGTAPSVHQIRRVVRLIEKTRSRGKDTLIFCGYGAGRSGVMVAAYEAYMIMQTYPLLHSEVLELFLERRAGRVPLAMRRNPTLSFAQLYNFVNVREDHMIENPEQFEALLSYAEYISDRWCYFHVQ
eukprot:GEMP01080840.1.p1 GENE.GEMP01080840.1~~GEMP01080840.1.p1  ORF type:complete len:297 (+),score=41.22 GEMP01080840.1:97-987(+)